MADLRIFLLDDHQIFRTGLKLILARVLGVQLVGEASDCATALPLLLATRPDLVLADIHMPGDDGITFAESVRRQAPDIRFLFLSSESNIDVVQRALDAECSGFVQKECSEQELIRALDTVRKGGIYLCPDIASAVLQRYRRPEAEPKPAEQSVHELSVREKEILELIARGFRNKEIADRLEIGVKSVETYRSRLLKKLNYGSTAELVRYAIRIGLIKP